LGVLRAAETVSYPAQVQKGAFGRSERRHRKTKNGTDIGARPMFELVLRSAHGAALLKAFTAEYRTSLCGTKRYGGLLAALRAVGLGLRSHGHGAPAATAACTFGTLGLAAFAPFRFVFEAFVGEEHLFAGSKNKLSATLRALQHLVVVFHEPLPLDPGSGRGRVLGTSRPILRGNVRGKPGWVPWACER